MFHLKPDKRYLQLLVAASFLFLVINFTTDWILDNRFLPSVMIYYWSGIWGSALGIFFSVGHLRTLRGVGKLRFTIWGILPVTALLATVLLFPEWIAHRDSFAVASMLSAYVLLHSFQKSKPI